MKQLLLIILSALILNAQNDLKLKIFSSANNFVLQTIQNDQIVKHKTDNKKVLDEVIIQIDKNSLLQNKFKIFFVYDNRANIICRTSADWINNDWSDDRRSCFEYNNRNQKIELYDQEIHNNEWFTMSKQIFTYDENNQLVKLLMQDNRNDYATDLENSSMYEYSYDEFGNQVREISSMWLDWEDVPRWEYQHKNEKVFRNSLLTEEYSHWWNNVDSLWELTSKSIFSHNRNGYLYLKQHYYNEDGNWQISRREQLKYDASNNVIDSLCQNWRDNIWQNDYQKQCEYTGGLLYKERRFTWDYSEGNLSWNDIITYEYNDKNLINKMLEEYYKDGELHSSRRSEFYYDDDGDISFGNLYILDNGLWLYKAKNIFTYKTIVEVEKENQIEYEYSLLQNYPNPFNPSTTIKFSIPESGFTELKIFNVLGEEIETLISGLLSSSVYNYKWNASQLPSGIYLYRLRSGNYSETKKLILVK